MAAAAKKTSSGPGFSDAEREAMKARAEELKASGRGGKKKGEEAEACVEAIEKMPDEDRAIAERVHTVVAEAAPGLRPKTWYGMPAYANDDDKVVLFFKPASKFGVRYATLGFNDAARLDDGDLWPTEYAVTSSSAAVMKTIRGLVTTAVSG